ncbi:MAG: RidA family protein [Deltaproteobacteria bacterium]|nr:RidA family protein [Deltaproteobacteria bacterium]
MAKEISLSDKVDRPRVPLLLAVKVGNLIFVSSTTPFSNDYQVAKGDFPAQMRQTMENVKAILEESVSSLDKVVKVNVILTRTTDFQAMNEIYRTYFKEGHYPAQTTIEAKLASKEFLLEIECVADV